MIETSHIGFIKKYEEACALLNIPEKHIIIRLSDYKKMKKRAYREWYLKVEREGFSTRGLPKPD